MGKRRSAQRGNSSAKERLRAAPAKQLPPHWPALTGLRGMAALAVFLLHAYLLGGRPELPLVPTWLFESGWSGVDVFFTLSAFLLTLPLIRPSAEDSPPSLRTYAERRLLRILPAYYVQLSILLALAFLGTSLFVNRVQPDGLDVIASLLFAFGIVPGMEVLLPPWWTLPVELGFYLLLPLFAGWLRKGRWTWLMVLIALSIGFRFWIMLQGLPRGLEISLANHLPGRLHQFLIGMLAAYVFTRLQAQHRLPRPRRADLWALFAGIAFVLLPALGYLVTDQPYRGAPVAHPLLLSWHIYASFAIAVLLLAIAAGAPLANRLLSAQPLQALGVISYSLYLWHFPIMLFLREEQGGMLAVQASFWPFLVLAAIFSLVVAAASWWLVERPAMRWAERRACAEQAG